VFLYYTFYSQINEKHNFATLRQRVKEMAESSEKKTKKYSLTKNIIMIILGLGGVLLGGEFVVRGGVGIAEMLGMSQTLIGLTIVAIGTSLPEITTGIVAVLKGKDDIAVGNVVGSSVFNILFILGTAAVINPITLSVNVLLDIVVMIVVTVFLFFTSRSRGSISRGEGIFFIAIYVAYIVYIIHRG
jgi:cation:H+ antiporter